MMRAHNDLLEDLYNLFYEIYNTDYNSILHYIAESNESIDKKIERIKNCISDIDEYMSILEEYKKAYNMAIDECKEEQERLKKLEEEKAKSKEPKYSVHNEPKKPYVKDIQLQYVDSYETDTYTDYTTPSGKVVRVYKN